MGMLRARTVIGCNAGRATDAAKGIATAGDDGSGADPAMPNDSSAVSGVGSAGATASKGSTGPGASPSRSGSDEAGASVSRLKRYAEVSAPSPSSMSSSIRDRSPSVRSPSGAIHVGAGDAGRRTLRCPEGLAMTVASGYAAINSACIAGSFSHRQRAGYPTFGSRGQVSLSSVSLCVSASTMSSNWYQPERAKPPGRGAAVNAPAVRSAHAARPMPRRCCRGAKARFMPP